MPYFEDSWRIDIESAILNINRFMRSVDEVLNFNIIGGEPFIYDDLHIVLAHINEIQTIRHIAIFTNGTVIPNNNCLYPLKNKKIEIVLSDYGNLKQMAKFVNWAETNDIRLTIRSAAKWIDFGNTTSRNRNKEELKKIFSNCDFSDNCKALLEDKLFVCERSARLFMLNKEQKLNRDYVFISHDDKDITREKIRQTYCADSADACNYCDAGVCNPVEIEAGLQMRNRGFCKSKYTIVNRNDL